MDFKLIPSRKDYHLKNKTRVYKEQILPIQFKSSQNLPCGFKKPPLKTVSFNDKPFLLSLILLIWFYKFTYFGFKKSDHFDIIWNIEL